MKKLLLLLSLLLSFIIQAQDAKLIQQLRSSDYEQAKEFANQVATGRTDWELIKEVNSDKALTFIYIEASLSKDKKEAIKTGKLLINNLNTITVKFTVFYEGENKNLEQTGIRKYSFYYASGKYLDLFPLWQKVFNDKADLNLTPKEFKMQESRVDKYFYKFRETKAPQWLIEKAL